MLKKIALSTLLTATSIATAQISIDVDMTINKSNTQDHRTRTVIINENTTVEAILDDSLLCSFIAKINDEIVSFEGQLFETTKNNELIPATEVLTLEISSRQSKTITVQNVDNDYELILIITPTIL